jgi:predicted esterase
MKRIGIPVLIAFCVILNTACFEENGSKPVLIGEEEYKTFYRIANSPINKLPKPDAWKKAVPGVKSVSIKSTADETMQPAIFYDSGSKRSKPLLLVLHSWSADYQQQFSIPYGMWAVRNDWVFIHPDYRGEYTNPDATASEKAIRDILDALEYARRHADIDPNRIYIAGFSGGGMTTLIMVGRYPEIWAGAVAWVPVYDLTAWYRTTRESSHDYSEHIANSCGGPPHPGSEAEKECLKRSPVSYLKNAAGKGVPVYIGTGIRDPFVPPSHAIRAFNDLADPKDRISEQDIEFISTHQALPPLLSGTYTDPLYDDADIELVFERKSVDVTLKIFDGKHDVIYNAGLVWLSEQRK